MIGGVSHNHVVADPEEENAPDTARKVLLPSFERITGFRQIDHDRRALGREC